MNNSIAVRDPEKVAEWTRHIENCQASGLPVTEWCESNGFNTKTYYYWKNKLNRIAGNFIPNSNGIYEIPIGYVNQPAESLASTITVGGLKADIYKGADAETLTAIIKAMQQC